MAPLRASVSCTTLPAYCLANCTAPEESSLMARSKRICFQSDFEGSDDACEEEGSEEFIIHQHGKKRRLTVEQVKSLEKNFELENKLDPGRKIQIANELGLQPRQVAVWFQNRRARWKTKKLEKDYDALKMDFFSLKEKYDVLLKEKQNIETEMMRLQKRLHLANSQTEGTEEDMEANSNQIPTSELQQSEKQSHRVKQQQDVINENYTVLAVMEKKGSSLSDMDGSEISNTSSPGCLENKVSRIMQNAAATRFLSNLTSYPEIKSLPILLSESLLKKVQAAPVKLEPEDAHRENACQNLFFEADHEADVVLWDWDLSNFDLNI